MTTYTSFFSCVRHAFGETHMLCASEADAIKQNESWGDAALKTWVEKQTTTITTEVVSNG